VAGLVPSFFVSGSSEALCLLRTMFSAAQLYVLHLHLVKRGVHFVVRRLMLGGTADIHLLGLLRHLI